MDQPIPRLRFLCVLGGGAVAAGTGVWTADAAPLGETITVPAGVLHGTVAVVVQVSPAKGVLRVELFVDGKLLGSDNSAPYAFVWDTTKVSDGNHILRADSFYKNRKHSGMLTVAVDNSSAPPIYPSNTLYPSDTAP